LIQVLTTKYNALLFLAVDKVQTDDGSEDQGVGKARD